MSDEVYGAFIVLALAAFAVEAWRRYSSSDARQLRLFSRSEETPVPDCNAGSFVKVAGVVEAPGELLSAPVSGAACVAWSVSVIRIGSRDTSEPTRTLCIETSSREFVVSSPRGAATFAPDGGTILLLGPSRVLETTNGALTEAVRDMLERRGFDRAELGGLQVPLLVHEAIIAVGDRVKIGGIARWDVDSAGAPADTRAAPFRDSPRSLRVVPTTEGKVVLALERRHSADAAA